MIKLENVSKSYGDKTVLDGINQTIEKGEKVSLKGASGTGKTTLIRLICGFEKADRGKITVDGKISAVFQENRLFDCFSVYENVYAVCDSKEKTEKHLRAVGLWDDRKKLVTELSGGMARRCAIARALSFDSDILILDEPFTGIDSERKYEIISHIKEHTKEKTIILISHDENECLALCQRQIKID